MKKKRARRKGMPLVMVWAVSEFTKARVLSDVGGVFGIGLELEQCECEQW